MIIKQKGIRVSISRFVLLIFQLLLLISIIAALVNFVLFAASSLKNETYALSFVISDVFTIVFLLPVWFFLWMFPDIALLGDGIQFQALFLKELVPWNEITDVVERKTPNFSAILLKKGRRIMFWNKLYGYRIGFTNVPVVILSVDQRDLEKIKNLVKEKSLKDYK